MNRASDRKRTHPFAIAILAFLAWFAPLTGPTRAALAAVNPIETENVEWHEENKLYHEIKEIRRHRPRRNLPIDLFPVSAEPELAAEWQAPSILLLTYWYSTPHLLRAPPVLG